MKKAKIGRPPVPKKLAKGSLLSVRFSADERKALERAAERDGLRLSEWARRTLLAGALRLPMGHAQTDPPNNNLS